MANRKSKEPKLFPCECGKSFATAKEFSDHVGDCSMNPVIRPEHKED